MAKAEPAKEANERPILFSGPMVRAILSGAKSQTRRVIKTKPGEEFCDLNGLGNAVFTADSRTYREVRNPYGEVGDRLWVREKWGAEFNQRFRDEHGLSAPDYLTDGVTNEPTAIYAADRNFPMLINEEFHAEHHHVAWRPSIHMRRAASRIILELTGVRVERLQDITERDAISEGIKYFGSPTAEHILRGTFVRQFAEAWGRLNAKRGAGWDVNPFVWVLSFRRFPSPHERTTDAE